VHGTNQPLNEIVENPIEHKGLFTTLLCNVALQNDGQHRQKDLMLDGGASPRSLVGMETTLWTSQ
jgi:hypothetical protein